MTTQDIRDQRFTRYKRTGYRSDEVDAFLRDVEDGYQRMEAQTNDAQSEAARLRVLVHDLEAQASALRQQLQLGQPGRYLEPEAGTAAAPAPEGLYADQYGVSGRPVGTQVPAYNDGLEPVHGWPGSEPDAVPQCTAHSALAGAPVGHDAQREAMVSSQQARVQQLLSSVPTEQGLQQALCGDRANNAPLFGESAPGMHCAELRHAYSPVQREPLRSAGGMSGPAPEQQCSAAVPAQYCTAPCCYWEKKQREPLALPEAEAEPDGDAADAGLAPEPRHDLIEDCWQRIQQIEVDIRQLPAALEELRSLSQHIIDRMPMKRAEKKRAEESPAADAAAPPKPRTRKPAATRSTTGRKAAKDPASVKSADTADTPDGPA